MLQLRAVRFCGTAATILMLLVFARVSHAGELTVPGPRQGYFVALGVQRVGVSSKDSDLGRFNADYGTAFVLRLGEMVTPWLGFGLQADGGQAKSSRWSQGFGGLLLDVQLVPWRSLSVHASAGLGAVMARDQTGRVEGAKGTGGAYYGIGVGYDFFPFYESGSGGFGITPTVQMKYLPGSGFNSVMVWAGVDVVWWRGLDRQELELPPDTAFTRSD